MKKKSIIIMTAMSAIIALTSISCKKSYSCECVTTYTDGAGNFQYVTKIQPISEKMKDRQASAACSVSQEQMNTVNNDINTDLTGPYYDISSTCAVK